MSKEDILYKQEPSDDAGAFSDEQIYIAMDEWARQQSIAFAEWMGGNKYRYLKSNNTWTNPFDDSFSHEQLYDLFLTHQSQQK